MLARLGRFEPARDALRRALTLSIDPAERGRAHAALGRLFAAHGAAGKAVRELGKAVRLLPGDHALAAAYGRALVAAGDAGRGRVADARGAAPGADPRLIADAAAATAAPAEAERLLREALARTPEEVAIRAALARHLARAGRPRRRAGWRWTRSRAAPESAARRWRRCARATPPRGAGARRWRRRSARPSSRPPALVDAPAAEELLALALGARDRAALAALAAMAGRSARRPADGARAAEAAARGGAARARSLPRQRSATRPT